MRNKEIKEKFVNEITNDEKMRIEYITIFEECSKFEEQYDKDICDFTVKEFKNMINNLTDKYSADICSGSPLNIMNISIVLNKYTKYVNLS